MKLLPSDPDVETLVKRIARGDLDLQPNFQRGDVWRTPKRQKLIDSILRGWHVPPIHVVQASEGSIYEVLDGQQRLRSIFDFYEDRFPVLGETEPASGAIQALDGLRYSALPYAVRRAFDNFTIRQFTIVDYSPEEPAELFYRLNQPVVLTAAETRNAFVGEARSQIRKLVNEMEKRGYNREAIGFSNARMAYDDVVSRLCLCLERQSIFTLVTASALAQRYRRGQAFSEDVISSADAAIKYFSEAFSLQPRLRLNKAGLFSWLWFLAEFRALYGRLHDLYPLELLTDFEYNRDRFVELRRHYDVKFSVDSDPLVLLLEIYDDRVTSRVGDVSSVAARNLCLWAFSLASNRLGLLAPSPDAARTAHLSEQFGRELLLLRSVDRADILIESYVDQGRGLISL